MTLKRQAALRAIEEVEDGMVLGLGSGTTADLALEALGQRVKRGLRIVGIPSSEKTAALARAQSIPLTDFAHHPIIDLTIDGTDQIDRNTLNLIKGHGGALLREKIVAAASRRVIIIADDSKLADHLGDPVSLPVEVTPFGTDAVIPRLLALNLTPQLRVENGRPFITDGGNHILDCRTGIIGDPAWLESQLAAIPGLVESGLFIGLATRVIIAGLEGVMSLSPKDAGG